MGHAQQKSKVVRSSTLKITSTSSRRLVDIVQSVGGHSYLSGSHALQAYLAPQVFVQHQMPLHLFDWSCPAYPQLHTGFTANLAVLGARRPLQCGPNSDLPGALGAHIKEGVEHCQVGR